MHSASPPRSHFEEGNLKRKATKIYSQGEDEKEKRRPQASIGAEADKKSTSEEKGGPLSAREENGAHVFVVALDDGHALVPVYRKRARTHLTTGSVARARCKQTNELKRAPKLDQLCKCVRGFLALSLSKVFNDGWF